MADETKELVPVEEVTPAVVVASGIFGDDPVQALERARQLVAATNKLIEPRHKDFIADIQGKQYPKVDWWTAMGQPLGLSPQVEWVRQLDGFEAETWEARVIVTNRAGVVVSAGQAVCSASEKRWGSADTYARYSMAQTRATGKAYRLPLSFLAVLSGLAPTPAEEVPQGGFGGDGGDAEAEARRAEADTRNAAVQHEKHIKAFFAAFDPVWAAAAPELVRDDADMRDSVRHAFVTKATGGKWKHVRDVDAASLGALTASLKEKADGWRAWIADGTWLQSVPELDKGKLTRKWHAAVAKSEV